VAKNEDYLNFLERSRNRITMPRKPPHPRTKRAAPKKRKGGDSDSDDSSIDSKGNLRNFIDYDYDEEESADSNSSSADDVPVRKIDRPKRKAAIKAEMKMRRGSTSSTDSEEARKEKKKPYTRADSKKKAQESESKEDAVVPKSKAAKSVSKTDTKPKAPVKATPSKHAPAKKASKGKMVVEEIDESEEMEEDEDDATDSTDYDDSEDSDMSTDDESEDSRNPRIGLMISGFGAPPVDPNVPKKYKMKEQPQVVKRFVKLVQKESEEGEQGQNIDSDIKYFKNLSESKQNLIIEKMERKFSVDDEQVPLKFKLLEKAVPPSIEKIAMGKYHALSNMDPSSSEYYKCFNWMEGYANLPIGTYRDLPVKLEDGPEACAAFVTQVRDNMDAAVYGQDEAKLQILQFVSSWIANPKGAGNVLSIHGPMGVGKTTLVKEGVAKALGRPFHFISLGGATDAAYLDGHSYTYEGATWGRIADILSQSKCMNPIIYFDELDKISETPKGEEIMNLLIHITDSSQNDKFQDKYFTGIDLDLSRCLFIFSHNNHERVNPILRDRMYNIRVEGFKMKEKIVIAEQYLLPHALKEVGLHEKVSVSSTIVQYIIENHTGEEKGVRELKRCMQTIMSKLNLLRFYNDPKQVPFAIPEFALPFTLQQKHIALFLKKKEGIDASIAHLYT
jgi:ATP-dependent Lon protease